MTAGIAWRFEASARSRLGEPPTASLQRFLFDTVVYDAAVLRHLVEVAGADRVLGTDHPFEMAEDDPVGLVRAPGLGGEAERAILGGSAVRVHGPDG